VSLYLDEIFLNVASKESFKDAYQLMESAMKNGFPPGVTLKAGPWASNEEAKIGLVLDIKNHETDIRPVQRRDRAGRRNEAKIESNRRLDDAQEDACRDVRRAAPRAAPNEPVSMDRIVEGIRKTRLRLSCIGGLPGE
jgi:hypothetical protein